MMCADYESSTSMISVGEESEEVQVAFCAIPRSSSKTKKEFTPPLRVDRSPARKYFFQNILCRLQIRLCRLQIRPNQDSRELWVVYIRIWLSPMIQYHTSSDPRNSDTDLTR